MNSHSKAKKSLQDCFSYTPQPGMKHDPARARDRTSGVNIPPPGGVNVPPPGGMSVAPSGVSVAPSGVGVPRAMQSPSLTGIQVGPKQHDSASEALWSSFCDSSEMDCKYQHEPKHQFTDNIGDYDFESEEFFDDSDLTTGLHDSYDLPSASYQSTSGTLIDIDSKVIGNSGESCSRRQSHNIDSSLFHRKQKATGGDFFSEEGALMSEDSVDVGCQGLNDRMPSFLRRRKRIIDEIYDANSENCPDTDNITPRLKPSNDATKGGFPDSKRPRATEADGRSSKSRTKPKTLKSGGENLGSPTRGQYHVQHDTGSLFKYPVNVGTATTKSWLPPTQPQAPFSHAPTPMQPRAPRSVQPRALPAPRSLQPQPLQSRTLPPRALPPMQPQVTKQSQVSLLIVK